MRFIAAITAITTITTITVCCHSSAVQAQKASLGKRPVAPVSRAQVDDPSSRAQVELKNEHQDVQPLPPELEHLLRDWAASSEKIQRLEGEHLRRVYDLP